MVKAIERRRNKASLFLLYVAVAVLGITRPAVASEKTWELGGYLKYQYTYTDYRYDDLSAVVGHDPARDHSAELRLKADGRSGPWDFAAHYEYLFVYGDSLETRRRLAALGVSFSGTVTGLPDDRRQLFNLTDESVEDRRTAAVQRLDRLSVGYTTDALVMRIGRQAVSWGNGLVFQVLDFINPFSPIAIDKDYKSGEDMLYAQWIAGGYGDGQVMIVPRRDQATGQVQSEVSSYAAKLHTRNAYLNLDVIAARHYGENMTGLGVVKSLGGAVWRLDAVYLGKREGGGKVSLITNVDYSWTWGDKNIYGYAEYFRNGIGTTDRASYAHPDQMLTERIARGEVFSLARDNAALGLRVELDPLFNLYNNLIWNLNDGSAYLQIRGLYEWRQNVQLIIGMNLPFGNRGDEYGGIPADAANAYVAPGRAVYGRVAHYF